MSCYKDYPCWKKGFKFLGDSFKSSLFSTVDDCRADCVQTEGCVAFSTRAGTENKCLLFKSDTSLEEAADPIAISVRLSCLNAGKTKMFFSVYNRNKLGSWHDGHDNSSGCFFQNNLHSVTLFYNIISIFQIISAGRKGLICKAGTSRI